MKLSDRQHTPVQIPSVQPGTQGGGVPTAPGKPQNAASHSEVERDLSNESGRSSQYPMASEQEVQTREKRSISKFSKPKPPKPKPKPPTPTPPKPTPPTPIKPPKPKPAGGPNGANNAVNNLNTISSLHKQNAFTPIASNLAAEARNSFISHSVNTLVGLPFSVVEHMASKEIRDRIDAQAKMPGAEKKDAQGVTTTNDPAATEQQKLEARLEDTEIKTEVMVNSILSINEGADAKAVGKDPNAATDVDSRLNALEGRMNTIENQMKDITKRYNLIYDPYVAPESSETPTAASRMETVEKRYKHMNQQLKLLITVQKTKMEDAE
jgi:hypothetical protein